MTDHARQRRPSSDGNLPEFERPPLAEVVLGIQFDPLVGLSSARLGEVWGLFRDQFPTTTDHLPLPAVFERLGPPSESQAIQLNFDVLRPPLPRCWFVSAGDDEVLQFQQDRFHHNWRRREGQPDYPRYRTIRSRFESELASLTAFISASSIGSIEVNQCEVTYINNIVADECWTEHAHAGRVLRLVTEDPGLAIGPPEHVRCDTAFPILDEEQRPRGRLHVSLVSGFMKESAKPMFALKLTARGAPMGQGVAGALEFLDLGRRSIVRGFAELTTDRMHQVWGRTR